ncbi:hypothetical protein [Nonomuraea sp. NPDC050643]|uniref:hypothetical protein n=1 Tax=Nonomuraea sp. NPDC050643 TaxID=3155660 RepID=UPI0033CB1549
MTSSDQISPQHLTEIKALIERAHIEIGEVAEQGPHNRWRMHVPADPSRDTDLVISEALKGAEDLAAEVGRLNKYIDSIDRLNEVADADWKQEVDRLTSVAHNQARMISEITAACMAAEAEVERLRTPPPPGELRGLDTMCAALHAATETDPVVKEVAWRTFALIRAHREQGAEVDRLNTLLAEVREDALHLDLELKGAHEKADTLEADLGALRDALKAALEEGDTEAVVAAARKAVAP